MFQCLVFATAQSNSGFNSDYCQADPFVPSSVPNAAPSGYVLQFAQIITRHGDRVPTDQPVMVVNDSLLWNCTLENLGIPTVTDSGASLDAPGRLYRLSYMPGREMLPGNCMYGQLTAKGAAQHYALGKNFNAAYLQVNPIVSAYTDVWVRSTNLQRTVNSVQADLLSVFPLPPSPQAQQQVINIRSIDDNTDNLSPNTNLCPRLSAVYHQQEDTPQYQAFLANQSVTQAQIAALGYFGGQASSVSVSSFIDMCWCRSCHGYPLPPGVTQQLFQTAVAQETYAKNNLFWGGRVSLPWAIGSFVGELRDNVLAFVANGVQQPGGVPAKLMFFSGHDSTLVPLSNALFQVNDLQWAPYASHMEIEVWRETSSGAYFVKTSYNGKDFVVPGCSSTYCPVQTWSSSVSWVVPQNFLQECHQTPPPLDGPTASGLRFKIPPHFFT